MGFFVSIKATVFNARLLHFLVASMFSLLDGRTRAFQSSSEHGGRGEQSSHETGRREKNDDERRENIKHEHEEEET